MRHNLLLQTKTIPKKFLTQITPKKNLARIKAVYFLGPFPFYIYFMPTFSIHEKYGWHFVQLMFILVCDFVMVTTLSIDLIYNITSISISIMVFVANHICNKYMRAK